MDLSSSGEILYSSENLFFFHTISQVPGRIDLISPTVAVYASFANQK
jgi:hypothetical protein